MSFRSIEQLLRRNSKTKISQNIVESIRDQKEEQYVQSLRELLLASNQLPEKFDDYHVLLRFLRRRGFNILKAKEMFLNMLKWREDCAVDAIAKGMSNFSKSTREMFIEIQNIDSNYYPETLNQLYIINAGSGFRVLWKVLQAFMEARTSAKIQVLGTNYLTTILEAVDPSNLPDFLGGTCTCSATGGCLLQDKGPWIDLEIVRACKVGNDMSENIQQKQVNEQISEKIRELEDRAAQTMETLQTLICKQQEFASHIEQLRKLLRDDVDAEKKANIQILK